MNNKVGKMIKGGNLKTRMKENIGDDHEKRRVTTAKRAKKNEIE